MSDKIQMIANDTGNSVLTNDFCIVCTLVNICSVCQVSQNYLSLSLSSIR